MRTNERKGSVIVLVAVLMVALLGFGAFAVDVAQMQAYKSELRRTADAAVLAATLELMQVSPSARAAAATVGRQYVQQNPVMGDTAASTFEFGFYAGGAFIRNCIAGACTQGNIDSSTAMRVTVQGTGNFYLAQFIGQSQFSLNTQATAYLPVANSRCARPWAVPIDTFTAHFATGIPSYDQLRRLANLGTSKTFVVKRNLTPSDNPVDFFGAVNLPTFRPASTAFYDPINGAVNYALNIPRGTICHRLNAGDVIQAKIGSLDSETINGLSGGGMVQLCANLLLNECYNDGGQIGVATRIPIVADTTGPPCTLATQALYPDDIYPSTNAVRCLVVRSVHSFVVTRGLQNPTELGRVIGVYAGQDTLGPVRAFAQRPILVQ